MTSTPDLELALRIRADLDAARRDVRGFNTELKAAESHVRLTRTELRWANDGLKNFAAGHKSAATAVKDTTAELKREGAALDEVEKKTRKLSNSQRTALDAGRKLLRGDTSGAAESLVTGGVRAGAIGTTAALTGLAAAIGVTIKLMSDAQAESTAYDQSIIVTGGAVGKTREELAAFAGELDKLEGVTTRKAAAGVAQIAATGEFAGEQFELASRSAVQWSSATGASLDTTVDKFRALQKDPVAALLELTEKENFLTEAQLNRVRTLVEEGREQEAVTEAFRIYAGVIDDRAPKMLATLSPFVRMWRDIKNMASEAWDAMVGVGRSDALAAINDRIGDVVGRLPWWASPHTAALRAGDALRNRYNPDRPDFSNVTSGSDTRVDAKAERERMEAQKQWQQETQRYLSDQLKMEAEINKARAIGLKAGKSEAEIEKQVAAIRKTYADRVSRRAGSSRERLTDAQRAEQSAQRELDNLTKQSALLGQLEDGEKRVTEEARIRYETTEGAYRLASASTKQQLLDQAKLIDATRAQQEAEAERKKEIEETTRGYERLRDELRTPMESDIEAFTEKVRLLNQALADSPDRAAEARDAMARLLASGGDAPKLGGRDTDLTGLGYERAHLDDYSRELDTWYQTELAKLAAYREQKGAIDAEYNEREAVVQQQHQARLADLQAARHDLAIASTQSMFDSMAQIALAGAGEQSKAYQILFAISKGFAVAQAAVALAQNVAEASKVGFPYNLPLIAAAIAQGAQIASLLSAANYSGARGYATGGKIHGQGTGTSDSVPIWASVDEFMVRAASARQPGAYAFLEDFNRRGMAAIGDWQRAAFAAGGRITAPVTTASPNYVAASGPGASAAGITLEILNFTDRDKLAEHIATSDPMKRQIVNTTIEEGDSIRGGWQG